MNKQVKVFCKFPCNLIEIISRDYNQKKYSRNDVIFNDKRFDKLYITTEGDLLITRFLKLDKGTKINLKNLKKEKSYLICIRYERLSNDYKKEPFAHNFNGSESIYSCNFFGNVVLYITGKKDLWERVIEK